MNKKNIRLDLISIDKGTQQRPLDEDVLNRYMSLIQDGVEFPPVEVVTDGVNFWVWDGFHRIECARRRGCKDIQAYVNKGTLRDAIWFSFGANKTHGLPRQKGIAKEIIKQILTDKRWSKQSLTIISKHVGVTRQYVTQIRDEFAQAHGASNLHETKNENRGFRVEKSEKGASSCTLLRDGEIEVKSSRGRKYKQRSQEKQHKASEPIKDQAGRIIPEHLQELYKGREIIAGFVRDLTQLKSELMRRIDLRDLAFSLINITAFQAEYETLRRRLKSAMPYAVCVYCGGDSKDCKACKGFGFLNKDTYEAAPKELKL